MAEDGVDPGSSEAVANRYRAAQQRHDLEDEEAAAAAGNPWPSIEVGPRDHAQSDGGGSAVGVILLGVLALATLIIPVTWWSGAGDDLRSVLEDSPLSGSVAERAREDGNPILVGGVLAGITLALLVAIAIGRRRVAARVASGDQPRALFRAGLFGSTVLFTLVLVFGVSLVPVAGSIAAGNDLEPNSDPTVFSGTVPIVIVAVGVIGLALWSNDRCLARAERRAAAA